MAVTGELNPIGEAGSQIVHEPHGTLAIPTADEVGDDQPSIGFDCRPCPSVAGIGRSPLCRLNILLLGVGEAPNLVHLNALRLHVSHMLIVICHARLASVHQKLRDRDLAHAYQPGHGADAVAFAEKVKDAGPFGGRELVHEPLIAYPRPLVKHIGKFNAWRSVAIDILMALIYKDSA